MKEHEKLLNNIRKRPGIYFGKKSLILLKTYVDGYMDSVKRYNPEKMAEYQEFRVLFLEYILNIYPTQKSLGWTGIIYSHFSDDEEAFDKFYDLYDNFLNLCQI